MDSDTWSGIYGPVYAALMALATARVPVRTHGFFDRATGLREIQKDVLLVAMKHVGMVEFVDDGGEGGELVVTTDQARMYGVARLLLMRRNAEASKVLLDCPRCSGDGCGMCGDAGEFVWESAPEDLRKAFVLKESPENPGWEPPPAVYYDIFSSWEKIGPLTELMPPTNGSVLPGSTSPSPLRDLQVIAVLGPIAGSDGPHLTNSRRVAFLLVEMGCDPLDVHVALSDPDEASDLYDQTPFNVFLADPEEVARDMRRQFSRVVLELGEVSEDAMKSVTETVAHGVKDNGLLCVIGGLSFSGDLRSRFEANVSAVETLFNRNGDPPAATPENVSLFVDRVSIMVATTPWTKIMELNVPGLPRPGYLVPPVPGGEPGYYCLRGGAAMTECLRALCRLSYKIKSYQVPTTCFVTTDGSSSTGFAVVTRTFRSSGSRYDDACMAQCMAGTFSFYMVETDPSPTEIGTIKSMRERITSVPQYVTNIRQAPPSGHTLTPSYGQGDFIEDGPLGPTRQGPKT